MKCINAFHENAFHCISAIAETKGFLVVIEMEKERRQKSNFMLGINVTHAKEFVVNFLAVNNLSFTTISFAWNTYQ